MPKASGRITPPTDWRDSLERSKSQIAAGQQVDLLPVLDRLRRSAEALEEEQGFNPEGRQASDEA